MPLTCHCIRDQLVEYLLQEHRDHASVEALIHSHLEHCLICAPAAREFAEALVLLAPPVPERPAPQERCAKVPNSILERS
jgi:hypothetical protein